jgi:hypothetical protein
MLTKPRKNERSVGERFKNEIENEERKCHFNLTCTAPSSSVDSLRTPVSKRNKGK